MIRFNWSRDWMNKENPRKITGIQIRVGYGCRVGYDCKNARQCRYYKRVRRTTKRHNSRVAVNNWFMFHFKIKLPWRIYTTCIDSDLSGTDRCPFNMCRRYTCFNCTHTYYDEDLEGCCNISCEDRKPIPVDSKQFQDWGKYHQCGCFNLADCYRTYNRRTGEYEI